VTAQKRKAKSGRTATRTTCVAHPDRVVLTSSAIFGHALGALTAFRTVSDYVLYNINEGIFTGPYGRIRRLVNDLTKTRLDLRYRPRYRGLAPLRVDIVPDDLMSFHRRELEAILAAFSPYRLVIVEFSLDFPGKRK